MPTKKKAAGPNPDVFTPYTFTNPLPGYTGGNGSFKDYTWFFDTTTCSWDSSSAGLWSHNVVDWQMENKAHNVSSMAASPYATISYVNLNVPQNEVTWPGAAPFTARTSGYRQSRWGRASAWSDAFGSSTPMNLWLKIGGKRYVVPDLWVQAKTTDFAISSNWKDYGTFHPNVAGGVMECYAYEDGDLKKPCVVRFTCAKSTVIGAQDVVVTKVAKARDIDMKVETVTAWQDEFNYRLAIIRFNYGVDAYYYGDKDGYLGWMGSTQSLVKDFLRTDVPLGDFHDPIIILAPQDITMTGKDLYVASVQNSHQEVDYVQTFTVQNQTDKVQSVKTSDYSWAHTDTNTFTWGMSEQISIKLTWKWEAEFEESLFLETAKTKVSFQFEAGYTHTFNQSWTETHTDTRTYSMAGQTVSLDPHTAAHVDAVLMKVTASGVLGQAVEITGDPGVRIAPLNGVNQRTLSFWDADIDLAKAATALRMSSIHTKWTPKNGPDAGKTIEGAFCTPTLAFVTKVGAAGTVQISPAPYVPKSEQPEAVRLMQAPSLGGGE